VINQLQLINITIIIIIVIITITFCGVSIPAEGSLEFSERGTLDSQSRIMAEEMLVKHRFQQRGMAFNSSFAEDLLLLTIL